MGVRFPGAGNNAILNNAPVTTAETIVAQWNPVILTFDFQQVALFWLCNFTTGASTTTVTMRIRRGPLVTSPQINVGAVVAEGGTQTQQLSGMYVDTPGAVTGLVYTLTYQAGAATANSAITDVSVIFLGL